MYFSHRLTPSAYAYSSLYPYVRRSFTPDLVLVRQHACSLQSATGGAPAPPLLPTGESGGAVRDYRHVLRALRYANVPAVNSLDACLLFADRSLLVRPRTLPIR